MSGARRRAREDGKVPAFRGSKEREKGTINRNPETRNVRARGEAEEM